jgi:N,N-dimethylformamidase
MGSVQSDATKSKDSPPTAAESVLLAYSDQISVEQGNVIRFMVSCSEAEFSNQIVRLIHGDASKNGPGYKHKVIATEVNQTYKGRVQTIWPGSYVVVPDNPALCVKDGLSVTAWIFATTPGKGMQGILTKWCSVQGGGYGLFVDESGGLAFCISGSDQRATRVRTGRPLTASRWHFVAATHDFHKGQVVLYQRRCGPWACNDWVVVESSTANVGGGLGIDSGVPLYIGAFTDSPIAKAIVRGHFNGKIDGPALFNRALEREEIEVLERDGLVGRFGNAVVANWEFSKMISTRSVTDVSGNGHQGHTVNMPARGVTGHNWSGGMFSRFSDAPNTYNAIHFHDDDLADAGWDVDFEFKVPYDLKSGVYAAQLKARDSEFHVPFVVRPHKGKPTGKILFLAPSMTWQAYANFNGMASPFYLESSSESLRWFREDRIIAAHPELGLSLYDYHSDGSSPYYSTRLRPNVSGSPSYSDALFVGSHLLCADLYLTDWLTEKGYAFDVVTDEDLHFEGHDILKSYQVVVTGAHPEYWTKQMLAALEAYRDGGGRIMYLGGNGLYWVTSLDPELPVIEVRRSIGTSLSRAYDGEYYHSTTGEMGGMWRAQGQAPQKLLGVGLSAIGGAPGSAYRRLPGSFDPRAAFIFEGVDPREVIGNFGLNTGAAAGFEIDRLDYSLGTPPDTLLLASSSDHDDSYWHVVEEVSNIGMQECGRASKYVRADMTFYEHPGGGAVFSVGSIAWGGSLSHNDYKNSVSRITENVLTRFLLERRFRRPSSEKEG